MGWLDELPPQPMQFPHGEQWYRDRRELVTDRYNPARQVLGDWDRCETTSLGMCFFDSGSSSDVADAARSRVESTATLYCSPSADLRIGDRVWKGTEPDVFFYVNRRPEGDTNPFTGWRAVMAVPLDLTEG